MVTMRKVDGDAGVHPAVDPAMDSAVDRAAGLDALITAERVLLRRRADQLDLVAGQTVTTRAALRAALAAIVGRPGAPHGRIMAYLHPQGLSPFAVLFDDAASPFERPTGPLLFRGEGAVGDQWMMRNNATLLDSAFVLRFAFLEPGVSPERPVRFIGAYALDAATPWLCADGVDTEGAVRQEVVFRFLPCGAVAGAAAAGPEVELVPSPLAVPGKARKGVRQPVSQEAEAVRARLVTWVARRGGRPMDVVLHPRGEAEPVRGALFVPDWEDGRPLLAMAGGSCARDQVLLAAARLVEVRTHLWGQRPVCVLALPMELHRPSLSACLAAMGVEPIAFPVA